MARLQELTLFLDAYLDSGGVKDDSWNGLQVEGKQEVERVLFAVDAGMETFERALAQNADMVVVHHGMFWRSANPSLKKHNKKRVDFLCKHGISVYASHLPLDMHPVVGNNAQLIKILGFEKDSPFGWYGGTQISFTGYREVPTTLDEIERVLQKEVGAVCKILPFGPQKISRIAVCSGGGASYGMFMEAAELGVDLYISGDSTEMYQMAKDIGINVMFAGHHATEIVGVRALSGVIDEKFDVKAIFVDIPTGL